MFQQSPAPHWKISVLLSLEGATNVTVLQASMAIYNG